jgi:integrase
MAAIRKRGERWQVQIRRKGYPSQSRSFLSQKDGESWARHMEHRLDTEDWRPDQATDDRSVLDALSLYAERELPKKRAWYVERYIVRNLTRAPFASALARQLDAGDIASYRDDRLSRVQAATVRRELVLLQSIIKTATIEWGFPFHTDLTRNTRKPKEINQRDRRLSQDEETTLLSAAGDLQNPWLSCAIRLALETGMRRGELIRVRGNHIAEESQILLIPYTKNGIPRTIPLGSKALLLSLEWASKQDHDPISSHGLNSAWQRLLRMTNVDDLHFHDLRHEAISRFFELGLSIPEVCLISGHKDFRMLARYTHLKPESLVSKLG